MAQFDVAIVTMAHNENRFLPLWISHYSRMKKVKLYVIDHGSTDGSTQNLPDFVEVVRIPQNKAYLEIDRLRFVTNFCNALRSYFECIIYTDVDELLMLDPEIGDDFIEYTFAHAGQNIRAVGIEMVQKRPEEPALNWDKPLFSQRSYGFFAHTYSKPLITFSDPRWVKGFHSGKVAARLDPQIYLFHLRYCDEDYSVERRVARQEALTKSGRNDTEFLAKTDHKLLGVGEWSQGLNKITEFYATWAKREVINFDDFDFETIFAEIGMQGEKPEYGWKEMRDYLVTKPMPLLKLPERFIEALQNAPVQ